MDPLWCTLKGQTLKESNCILSALSNSEGQGKMIIQTNNTYHTSGGKLSNKGNLVIEKKLLDNFELDKKVIALKIDTEGHEYEVLEGGLKTIEKNLPEIIFEINLQNFDKSIKLLKNFQYNFYYIDEYKYTLYAIDLLKLDLSGPEGSNCLATQKKYEDLLKLI